ncbi:hypothetical protein KAR91_87920, partial [Candidatus Pacearchaeota archaeon]|nr:hypothetical protein [Candidatus Pacearchaeota archaeon]
MRVLKCYDCGKSNIKLRPVERRDKIRLVCGCATSGVIRTRATSQVAKTPHSFSDGRLLFAVQQAA